MRRPSHRPTPLILFALMLPVLGACAAAIKAATSAPQPVQICTATPAGSAGLMGCPYAQVAWGTPKSATDRVRASVDGIQQWLPYSAVTATTLLYGGNPAKWQSPAALELVLLAATPPAPPTPPPVTPPPAPPDPVCPTDVFIPKWTCTTTNGTVTCTAPAPTH